MKSFIFSLFITQLFQNTNGYIIGQFKGKQKLFVPNYKDPNEDMKELSYLQTSAIANIWLNQLKSNDNLFVGALNNDIQVYHDFRNINAIEELNYEMDHNIYKKYMAFTPKIKGPELYRETLSILVYSIEEFDHNDQMVNIDNLILSPHWNEKQMNLKSIKESYHRYFNNIMNIKYVYFI